MVVRGIEGVRGDSREDGGRRGGMRCDCPRHAAETMLSPEGAVWSGVILVADCGRVRVAVVGLLP